MLKWTSVCDSVVCTCECVWIQQMQMLWFLLTPPPLCTALVIAGSDDVTQLDGMDVLWSETNPLIFDSAPNYGWILTCAVIILNPGQTFATMATITGQCLRVPHHCSGFIALDFYRPLCPQCSHQSHFQMCQAAVSLQEKISNKPNICVICLAPNGMQISNMLKLNT